MNGDETVYGPARVGGDTVEYKSKKGKQEPSETAKPKSKWAEGMNGDETVYGPARVGGDTVEYKSKKGK